MKSFHLFVIVSITLWTTGFLYVLIFYHDDELVIEKLKAKESDLELYRYEIKQKDVLIDILRKQIDVLTEKNELENKRHEMNAKVLPVQTQTQSDVINLDYESYRRRIFEGIKDVSFYMNDKLEFLKANSDVKLNFKDRINVLLAEYYNFSETNSVGERKSVLASKLSKKIQQEFHDLQNPSDCSSAKTLVCNLNKGCGFGCQLHHAIYCFTEAYYQKRTLILESKGWSYDPEGYEKYFLPLSEKCTESSTKSFSWNGGSDPSNIQSISLGIIDSRTDQRSYLPLSIPSEYKEDIMRFHGNPYVWWIGQMFAYLMRLQPNMKQKIDDTMKTLQFETPCIGMHVRRTDKVNTEAAFHALDEYMKYADEFYNRMEYIKPSLQTSLKKRIIYLATDEMSTINETSKYTNYKFIFNINAVKTANTQQRYSPQSLEGLINDVVLLSKCEYLICTFSSQVCRMSYELMQSRYTDASWRFKSLDDIYYYGGQNEHTMRVIYDHIPQSKEEIELKVGDIIGMAGNHWNGYSKGRNYRTNAIGLFPSYKIEDIVQSPA